MRYLALALVLLICISEAFAGSECPSKRQLYPCRCINHKLTRRSMLTFVVCNEIPNTEALNRIFPTLSTLHIDKFIMYDSFWPANSLGASGTNQRALPTDWLQSTNIKEMEFIDTTLSHCFTCQWSVICSNMVTTKLRIVNSTSSEKLCTICDVSRIGLGRLPWMACLSKLEHFELTHGNIKSVTPEFFPFALRDMSTLILSHNQINKVERSTFRNLPNLKILDLSHNLIETIDHAFVNNTRLQYLDLSYNSLKMIGPSLITFFPNIKSLNFANNRIREFKRSDWRVVPDSLITIDFTGNPILCDCDLRWVNATFKIHVAIPGKCSSASPDEFHNTKLRTASRLLTERCQPNGTLLASRPGN